MAISKKIWLALILIGVIVVNFVLSVLFHGVFLCRGLDPEDAGTLGQVYPEYENCTVLDSVRVKDSAVTLIRTGDQSVFLLEFQKNLFLPRYRLQDATELVPENTDEYLAIQTVQTVYVIQILNREKINMGWEVKQSLGWEVKQTLQRGNFAVEYGVTVLVLLLVEYAGYRYVTISGKNRQKKNDRT